MELTFQFIRYESESIQNFTVCLKLLLLLAEKRLILGLILKNKKVAIHPCAVEYFKFYGNKKFFYPKKIPDYQFYSKFIGIWSN